MKLSFFITIIFAGLYLYLVYVLINQLKSLKIGFKKIFLLVTNFIFIFVMTSFYLVSTFVFFAWNNHPK